MLYGNGVWGRVDGVASSRDSVLISLLQDSLRCGEMDVQHTASQSLSKQSYLFGFSYAVNQPSIHIRSVVNRRQSYVLNQPGKLCFVVQQISQELQARST